MTATLNRLIRLNSDTPFIAPEGLEANELVQKNVVNFKKLTSSHLVLQFEYSVLCADIAHLLTKEPQEITDEDIQSFNEKLYDALVLAEILEHLYAHYLDISREAEKLKNHKNEYRSLLKSLPKEEAIKEPFSLSQYVRSNHLFFNWHRVFSVRTRRMFVVLVPFFEKQFYGRAVKFIENFSGPLFNWLSWLFFVPRLANNFFMLLKHLIIFDEKSKEYSLDWQVRFLEQLKRRWHEIANDLVWLIAGVLGCFVLTGALAPVSMYITIVLFFYDILVAGLRAYIDLSRLEGLAAEYKTLLADPDLVNRTEIEQFNEILQKRMDHDQKRLMLSVINTAALFIGMLFSIPALVAVSPVFPVVGSILILLITFAVFYANRKIEKSAVPEAIDFTKAKTFLSAHSLFQPPVAGGEPPLGNNINLVPN
ncbi:MAG: hypothetical protein LCH30_02785 [Proteobacteria bacterium]|nr:hypothetical protein [Pseudomonadota bacterium]